MRKPKVLICFRKITCLIIITISFQSELKRPRLHFLLTLCISSKSCLITVQGQQLPPQDLLDDAVLAHVVVVAAVVVVVVVGQLPVGEKN